MFRQRETRLRDAGWEGAPDMTDGMLQADLELYHGRASTCSKKVRLVLYEKKLAFRSHLLNLQKFEHLRPSYLALNPNGVVPTLVHRGRPVVESNVIIEYLEAAFPGAALVPSDPYERARMRAVYILTWMHLSAPAARALSEEELKSVLRAVPTEERRARWETVAGEGFTPEECAASERQMKETLNKVEGWLGGKGPWLLGDLYSLADIAIVPFVDRINTLLPGFLDEAEHPWTVAWFERMQARPSFEEALRFKDDPRASGLPDL